jgi:hypothetical protein
MSWQQLVAGVRFGLHLYEFTVVMDQEDLVLANFEWSSNTPLDTICPVDTVRVG